MLLLHPVREVVRYIPALLVTLIAGSRSDNPEWSLALLAVIVGLALTRWFTTTYRIGPETVQLRRGLWQRKTLTVPRSRIRSVDVQADLMHRLLGLVVLAIGTGQRVSKEERFHLDGVDASQVPELRALLLHEAESPAGQQSTVASPAEPERPRGIEIGHWRPGWVRYAPLSLKGLAIIGPIVGIGFKFGIAGVLFNSHVVARVGARGALYIAGAVAVLLAALVVVVTLADCLRYLTTYFGLRVIEDGQTLQLRHGLFTTRQTTLDLARLRGATLKEPLLLRLAGGAELEAIMTGTSSRQKILPQAPRTAVDRTFAQLLASRGTNDRASLATIFEAHGPGPAAIDVAAPAVIALTQHGARAQRRRFTRALNPLLAIAVVLAVIDLAVVAIPAWAWVVLVVVAVLAVVLAQDRYPGLGHAVIPGDASGPTWLITRHGSLDRNRDCLEAPGIIGWTVRQTFFQRRAGLATLVAATAAGKKRYEVVDVPLERAWALIDEVTPGQSGRR
jgi:putative membrane protein